MKMVSFPQVLYIGVLFIFPTEGIVNLARLDRYRGTASQSSTYSNQPWTADKAVDGQLQGSDENSCSFTKDLIDKTAWWKLPLLLYSNVAYLEIYFRHGTVNRHTGFSVFVFNETSKDESPSVLGLEVFAQDPSSCPSQIMNITINKVTKGVGLYNSKNPPLQTTCAGYVRSYATIEICEVKVMGCQARHYGENCDWCDTKCLDRQCDVFNGECTYGCQNAHMKSPQCNECEDGFYNSNCDGECGHCKNGEDCKRQNGHCINGCALNWKEPLCQACNVGFYNRNCDGICGHCKNGEDCNKQSGHCINGCALNWQEPLCQECYGGFYNSNCTGSCGHCKNGEDCDKESGHCINGCVLNWEEPLCQVCKAGFYGTNCFQTCGNCITNTTCDDKTGVCADGCLPNWNGPKCDKCKDGFYGSNCSITCGKCKNGTFCNNITGVCPSGCESNWDPPHCDECADMFYGENCQKQCGHCNETRPICEKSSGTCLFGCQENWNGSKCEIKFDQQTSVEKEVSKAGIIGGTLSALIALVLVGLLVTIVKRRKRKEANPANVKETSESPRFKTRGNKDTGQKYENSSEQFSDTFEMESNTSNVNVGEYYNTTLFNTNININNLQNIILEKSEGKNGIFISEYKRLPPANLNICQAAKRKENVTKNRFKTTFPYEHSRIILNEKWCDSDNDYINANFIRDKDNVKSYIAAQGPKTNTLVDFWRMIWQENVNAIVMLTNIIENGKNKCTQYWPDKQKTLDVGPCKISLLEESIYSFHMVRKLLVQRANSPEKRTISQFHFITWPDHGTPEEIELVLFHRIVAKRRLSSSPLLVHCSAGVGRTGTFIGLDSLLKQGKETGCINIFEFVKQMRADRMTMVQTPEQYAFLHRALQCAFKEIGTVISEANFPASVDALLNDTSPLNQRALYKEFKLLSALKPEYEDDEKEDAKKDENKKKNVSMGVLPVSRHRPYLTSYVKGRNDYINAVILASFTNRTGLIITQSPLPDTEVDLWRLCMDHEVAAIIVLDESDEENSWLPKRGLSRSCSPYTITRGETGSDVTGVSQDTLVITSNEQKRDIDLFVIPSIKDDSLLKGTELVLEKRKNSSSPCVIISKDGAGTAGIFCVLYNAMQQLRMDGEVDIFSTVRQIQIRRPEVITKLEEYRRCYQLISQLVSTEGIYANL